MQLDWNVKLGGLPITRVDGGKPTQETKWAPTVDYNNGNLFAGNLEGVNQNLGRGSIIAYGKQQGVDRTGRTLGFA